MTIKNLVSKAQLLNGSTLFEQKQISFLRQASYSPVPLLFLIQIIFIHYQYLLEPIFF